LVTQWFGARGKRD